MNTQNLSEDDQTKSGFFSEINRKKSVIVLCFIACIFVAVIFLWLHLFTQTPSTPVVVSQPNLQKQIADQVVTMLRDANPATSQEVNTVVTSLSKSKPATAVQSKSVISSLSEQ